MLFITSWRRIHLSDEYNNEVSSLVLLPDPFYLRDALLQQQPVVFPIELTPFLVQVCGVSRSLSKLPHILRPAA
jgi:hypothetical protein